MKTIDKVSKEYSISSYPNALDMQFACEMHFEAGAEWMRKELTRWHDPKKEMPNPNKWVLCECASGRYIVDYYTPEMGGFLSENNTYVRVIRWREIHE